jgi:hypothetical protein
MTNEQAKEILMLYRPGTADSKDPSFSEALEACQRDPELRIWFEDHCALYVALRAKFKQITPPEGLKEQIVSERRVQAIPVWKRAVLFAGVVAIAVLAVSGLKSVWPHPPEPHDFAAYRGHMISLAERGYYMDQYTSDLDQIRLYFTHEKTVSDYVVPDALQKNAKAAGCIATTWRNKQVAMICFRTDRAPGAKDKPDLWLFITDRSTTEDMPATAVPRFEKGNDGIVTASWTLGNRTYVLATIGDEQLLRRFL